MRKRFKAYIVILILVICVFMVLSSELFLIKNIYVIGNKIESKEDIIKISSLQYGQNIFRINKNKIMRNIFSNPRIKGVRIKRILPHSIYLDIIERESVALIPYLGSFLSIDKEAMVIEVIEAKKDTNVPIIEGVIFNDFKIGEILKIEDTESIDIIICISSSLKESDLIGSISGIDIEDPNNILLVNRTGIKIYLNNSNIEYKIKMAKEILNNLINDGETGIIDMRHDGNPIFKRE